ncbi:MAG: aspartate/glutamate racemase family protein [Acetobacteraceae bacterium]|nr:aspartate/glutamate racemase family protein [Acetobacteraceae bacterium]
MANDKILGVLGGMGPLASAQFMIRLTLLTPAERDQDHIPAILWSDPRIPDRMAAKFANGESPLPWLLRAVRGLEQAGCGTIVIPCNTAHGWHDELCAATALPIPHIVDTIARDLRRQNITHGTIGVMGTEATLRLRLYQDRLEALGYSCITPDQTQMDRQITPAIALVKANRVAASYTPAMTVARELMGRGAAAVVLGCTELPLAVQAGPPADFPMADSIDALARAAIAWARG